MKIEVESINQLTKSIEKFELLVSDINQIDEIHSQYSKQNPDCNINFVWGKNFIFGIAYNQTKDEEKLDRLEITFDEYMERWYSNEMVNNIVNGSIK